MTHRRTFMCHHDPLIFYAFRSPGQSTGYKNDAFLRFDDNCKQSVVFRDLESQTNPTQESGVFANRPGWFVLRFVCLRSTWGVRSSSIDPGASWSPSRMALESGKFDLTAIDESW
jgi:hypothetical protein